MATLSCVFATASIWLVFLLLPLEFGFLQGVVSLGINYGQVADNLPSPDQVVSILTSLKITKTRIYDTNPQVLTAFGNSGIDVIVTVPDNSVPTLTDATQALHWVTTNIKPYLPSTKITGIAVGNEVLSTSDTTLISNLVPAMSSIQNALVQLGLDKHIHVSTANSLAVLSHSYPPSSGAFRDDLANVIRPFLQFLADTNAPFWINAYPYFAYKSDPEGIPLDYTLFNRNSGTVDPYTKLQYDNMLYAMVDAVISAISKMGFDSLDVRVSETGWPSNGDPDEAGATVENARVYNQNLLKRQVVNEGTPLRPNQRLEVYLFALFNEDKKPGATSERNFGLYRPNGTMAYSIELTGLSGSSATTAVSLTSNANKAGSNNFGSLGYWTFVFLLVFQAVMKWPV